MEIRTYKVFKFDELPDSAKEKAIYRYADINVDHEWWDYCFDDAENIGLIITSYSDQELTGHFNTDLVSVANQIHKDHGDCCETYIDASNYLYQLEQLDDKDTANTDSIASEFESDIKEDYRIILNKAYEYLTSEEQIADTLRCNEYDFTLDGKID
ncbi:MAG: hypothetical protein GY941_21765 [Planctomycetes bacterium]|nr:hypothetical protein [Planctomycetota bacterium]